MILSWAPSKTSTTPSVISPSNPFFIVIQGHRLGAIFGTTSTHGCKHFAKLVFLPQPAPHSLPDPRSFNVVDGRLEGVVIMASQAVSMAISAMVSSPHP